MRSIAHRIRGLRIFALLLLFLTSCSPIQGYPGAALPPDQVALVRKVNDVDTATIDGRSFSQRGITVLPGNHQIEATRTVKGKAYDCSSHTEFDSYGYDSCRDRREEDIRKHKDPEDCYTSSYTTTITECYHDYARHSCSVSVLLLPGAEYLVSDNITNFDVKPMLFFRVGQEQPVSMPCTFDSKWTSYQQE